jgi:hypothetical protein
MPVTRHNPQVHEIPLPSAGRVEDRFTSQEEIRAALDIILAATANLRHYRDRLSTEDRTTTVRDIEEAAEEIARVLALKQSPVRAETTERKRRTR